ncbi:MAG: CPBP family intramembrane metalloprotease [Desulfuromonas sp.]|uniref:JDVT-CTERM system glutamic-type intramembrane protease MrtJ n=1 Tax=Desulfuromonas sp. TaxID=892 RepID=UPI000CABF4F3|nr:JDVT-CTERM system glutamic-type intramembrane protease [Desulfuromonas sp.]PLX85488.1 MAG: CPBP family intramembrane metalloprotease [Desulfuromonas sp.]
MWHDKQIGAAILAAPFFLAGLYLVHPVPLDLSWPLREPARFLLPALAYPVLEEAAFRGLIQGELVKRPFGRRTLLSLSGANWAASALFVAAHFLYHSPLWALAVLGPSLLFGHFRDRYDSIRPGAVLHVLYNTGYFLTFGA